MAIDDGGYPGIPCYFRNLSVRRNLVQNVGFSAIAIAEAPNAVIENNIIVQSYSGYGIFAPSRAHRTSPLDNRMTNATIRNNTIYFPASSANSVGIYNAFEGTDYIFCQ